MILVDANLLLYAEDASSAQHELAATWWDGVLSATAPVCLCWPVLDAFLRISTNPRVFDAPLGRRQALDRIASWLAQPCVRIVGPTERHWEVFRKLVEDAQAVGNLVSDAHLAALALQHGCELASTDADFARFPRLKWRNPLKR